ncbi:YdcF family protein [Acinetobacter gerneri]|uniref:YdcF family protein n=1 Tax=Acinetobacter gerneri TaxID=202952 RepID=A0AAW8JCX7_9GAMM|nr:YdcF family protein [Acinetobacter gerneri]MDQ9008218.1 YdcF family protein [Acinetobacter gerneri]MDQ9012368.1 YdcF family protein [Acinetobacter gerneri]MDQ9023757.1 YdcF family protein [Acinetobacter gerneri]MDQ9051281.1 YdcF family protein [Acinetobacter gerneri]MDQ9058860.1 YdcF family protein [Acinetobacter gerneri]
MKQHWMVRLVRIVAILFVLFGCFIVFLYTPFYSNLIVKALNTFVPVEVDKVAAKSQENAALTEVQNYEPGSDLWIARQAYLKVMEESIKNQQAQDLTILHARYLDLQKKINDEAKEDEEEQDKPVVPMLNKTTPKLSFDAQTAISAANILNNLQDLLDVENEDNKELMKQYEHYLKTHKVQKEQEHVVDSQIYKDIAYINQQNNEKTKIENKPYAIVVLGGGLTLADNQKDIVINKYTRLRLEKTLEVEAKTHLPIVLSGVESPYMQAWLAKRGVDANLLENRSMNTCENTRFSSLLLQKQGGAPTVLLVTDRYHMPRTRRLFALNGIETIPVIATMPTTLTSWLPSEQNYDHSRRANYEMLATIRDVMFGSGGCREVP